MYCNNVSLIRKKPNNPPNASSDARWQSKPANKDFSFFPQLGFLSLSTIVEIWKWRSCGKCGRNIFLNIDYSDRWAPVLLCSWLQATWEWLISRDLLVAVCFLNGAQRQLSLSAAGGAGMFGWNFTQFSCFGLFNFQFGLIYTLQFNWLTHQIKVMCGLRFSPKVGHKKATQRRKTRFELAVQRPPATTKGHLLIAQYEATFSFLAIAISEKLFITNIN